MSLIFIREGLVYQPEQDKLPQNLFISSVRVTPQEILFDGTAKERFSEEPWQQHHEGVNVIVFDIVSTNETYQRLHRIGEE